MSVTVQLMSSDQYVFSIFEGYQIRNLKDDVAEKFRIRDIDRISFFNNENEVDDLELVKEGSFFHVFIRDPPTVKITYENEKIFLYFDDQFIDTDAYQDYLKKGVRYEGIFVPDCPFILQVDSTMTNDAYLYIIRSFRDKWSEDNGEDSQDDEDFYFLESFSSYYLSKGEKHSDILIENEDDDYDFLEINPYHHLYAYLSDNLPRRKNVYDRWIHRIEFIRIDFL